MALEGWDSAGPGVRDRTHVQHDPAVAELLDERRIINRPYPAASFA
jgi:hypothetical protein